MRNHVLAWFGLCCAFSCLSNSSNASAPANPSLFPPTLSDKENKLNSWSAASLQQDTTVKPATATPVVIKPATGTKDTTTPAAHKPTAAPVVIKPASGDSSGKAQQDTTPAARTDTSANPAQDTTAKPKNDTALILPPDSASLKQDIGKFTLKGLVKDPSGTPVPGAMVKNKATKETVPTDAAGNFSIKAGMRDTILIAAPTFNEQAIVVENKEPLTVDLASASATKKTLSEVVVTALGIKKNTRAVGYAIQEVSGNAVQEAKETNFVNALSGKVAGLQVNTNTGSMGGSSKVTIRGTKSILGNNNALFVVDGVPIINNSTNSAGQQTGGGGYDYGSPIQDLNPEDMSSISVLKGAAATALYGSRGANGVVLISTKKGPDTEKGLGITYSINAQMDQVAVLPKYQNQYGGGYSTAFDTLYYNQHPDGFLNEQSATYDDNNGKGRYDLMPQYYADESWGPKLDGKLVRHYWSWDKGKNNPNFGQTAPWSAHPNNVKDFYKTGFTLTNNISMSGSNDKGSFRMSYGNMKQNFVLPNADLGRNNVSFNGNYRLAKNLNAVAGMNYSILKANARPGTGFTGPNSTLQFTMFGQRQLDNETQKRYAYADGSQLTWNRKAWNDPTVNFSNGPYWNRYMDYETDSRTRTYGFAGLDYEVSDWLNLSGRVFMDDYSTLEEERTAQDYLLGAYIKRVRSSREMNYQFTANAKKNFGEDFSLNATLGGNVMHRKWSTTGGSTVGGLIVPGTYNLNNSLQTAIPIDEYFEKQINSVFATATMGYKNLLFLDLTGRSDWSSTIAKNNNPYFYPSASLSFVFSDLLKEWKWLEFGKIRGSVAAVGNDTDPYKIFDSYNFLQPFGSNPLTTVPDARNNIKLKAERTNEYEVGTELKFLDNHIGLDVAYYNRTTKDQIIALPVPAPTGYTAVLVNGGSVQNQGFEIGLSLNPIRLKNGFRWDINANMARNRNKLLNMNIDQYAKALDAITLGTDRRTNKVSITAQVGESLGTIMGTDYVYDNNGNRIVGADGFYKVTDKVVKIGNVNPDFVGGITNSFSYKGIYLSALVDFQQGGDFFSYTNLYGNRSGLLYTSAENGIRENGIIVPGVTEDGKPNTTSIAARPHFDQNGGNRISKANLYDASYIYLREVKLGYNIPESVYKKIGAQTARLSLYGRNLWLIKSNAPNVDPSNITNSDGNVQGLEGGALPSLRSFGVNLNISF